MSDKKEIITKNREQIKSENLVTLNLWYCIDTETSRDYSHEYTVVNELTGTSYSYSQSDYGGYFKKFAEDQYTAQVNNNLLIIERVKDFLHGKSNKDT